MLDSGAQASVVSEKVATSLRLDDYAISVTQAPDNMPVQGYGGTTNNALRALELPVVVGKMASTMQVWVTDSHDNTFIFGSPAMVHFKLVPVLWQKRMLCEGMSIPLEETKNPSIRIAVGRIVLADTMQLPTIPDFMPLGGPTDRSDRSAEHSFFGTACSPSPQA